MNKLRADSYRAASRLAVAGILLLVFACGAWSQTVYSSPVRVTNTPLPVAAPEATPLYVTPTGGKMQVLVGNTVNVTAPSPLPVTMSGTLPVAQQGTVTVTPSGGQMSVTGTVAIHGTPTVELSGTPQVTLSGTPEVTLSTTGNTVKLAGTPYIHQWQVDLIGSYLTDWWLLPYPTQAVEAETVTARCTFPVGQKPVYALFVVHFPTSGAETGFPVPMTFAGSSPDTLADYWVGAVPGKLYIADGSWIRFDIVRTPHMTDATCWVSIAGRAGAF